MQSVPERDFDEDEEVRLILRRKVKNDVCLCKKYGKIVNGKACPFCCNSNDQGEPRKIKVKKSRIPTGNYGRTGSLAKPDLVTIPENDTLCHEPEELLKNVVIKTNIKTKTFIMQLKKALEVTIKNDSAATKNEGSDILKHVDTVTSGASLLQKSNKQNSYGTFKEHPKSKKCSVAKCDDLLASQKACCSNNNTKESRDLKTSENETISSELNELPFTSTQKPVLIPAQEFIGRYFTPSKTNGQSVLNRTQELETSGSKTESYVNGEEGRVANATDDQKITDGLYELSINICSDQNHTDNEKRCFQ